MNIWSYGRGRNSSRKEYMKHVIRRGSQFHKIGFIKRGKYGFIEKCLCFKYEAVHRITRNNGRAAVVR
jgi:hypothetical protein